MNQTQHIFRRFALASHVAPFALSVALATPVFAQSAPTPLSTDSSPTVAAEADAETIVVTGSRIARPELQAATPVNIVSSQAIADTGRTNISEVLRRQPAFATGLSQNNSNFQTAGNGVNTLDLRGLGDQRTLVLVNGRRFVSGIGGSSSVDTNMIATDLISNVQIVTGGASAVYGSDAVAGVVNFVLRDDFQGLEMRAQNGISSRGDSRRYRLSATAGTNFAGDRGNAWVNGVYDVDKGLLSRNRSFSKNDTFGRSSYAPQGSFGLNGTIFDVTDSDDTLGSIFGNDYTFDANNNLQQGFAQNADGFNRNSFRRLRVPVKRYIANGGMHFDITDNVTIYGEATYGKTKSSTKLEPYASAGGDVNIDGSGSIDVPGLAIDNAFIPAPIGAEIAARNSDADPDNDVAFIAFRRRLNDVFDRSSTNNRKTYRFVAGLKGTIADNWSWDVSYVYGHTRDYTASDTVRIDLLTNALDAVLLNGAAVCRDPAARAAGCQPLNIFGAGTASAASVAYIRNGGGLVSALTTTLSQEVASASITGPLFNLWGKDVKVVVGGEYRREKSSDDWDADTNAGNTLGNFLTDTRGKFNVKDVFGEIVAPIVEDRPLLEYLGIEAAARYDDYSTVGTVWSYKLGGEYAPTRDIRFRVMYSQASRAPNVSELFSAQSETFPGTETIDPCNGVTANSTGTYDAACRAIPGIAAAVANGGTFEYSLAEIQSINGFDGGNPNLREETAKTWTAGVVLTPSFFRRLNLTIDYYHIKLAGAVNPQPRDETAAACLIDPASAACGGFVTRLPSGKITRIDAVNTNTGGFLTSGVDVALNYRQPVGGGNIDLQANYTRLLKHKRKPLTGAPYINERGQLQDSLQEHLGSGYKNRFLIDTSYNRGPFRFSWTVRYFGKIKDTLDLENAPPPEVNNVGDVFYHDFQARFAAGRDEQYSFYVGVENAFDRSPPILPAGQAASGLDGVETSQEYDTIGRYFYAGVQFKF